MLGDKQPTSPIPQRAFPSQIRSEFAMSHGKQFTLYTATPAVLTAGKFNLISADLNDYLTTNLIFRKVAIVLEELGLTYESVYFDFSKKEHKDSTYLKINPNGRIPAIIDHHNNDFVVW